MRAQASHNDASSSSSLFIGEPSKDYVFASGCVAALALVAYSLVNLVLNNARNTSQPDIEIVIGYILIILGYLLLPGVGVLLVRRKRCLARNRALLMAETDSGDSQYMDAFGGKTNIMGRLFGSSQLLRDIDNVTKRVIWGSADGDEVQCSVCLNELEEGNDVRVLPCGHAFHRTCADLWLVNGQRNSCPLCMRRVCDQRGPDMVPVAC